MKFSADIDIDFGERNDVLNKITVIPAAIRKAGSIKRHNTGVHPTEIPYDPVNGVAAVDYIAAQERGYIKLDFLNIWIYKHIHSSSHLEELMAEPDWSLLNYRDFFSKLIHIGNHYSVLQQQPEPIDSIPRLAMFLALIRPGKRHLIGQTWEQVGKTIWDKDSTGYSFKKSHAVAYAHLVVCQMNLLVQNPDIMASSLQG